MAFCAPGLLDPATPENTIAVVNDHRLSWRDTVARFVEIDLQAIVRQSHRCRRRRVAVVAYLCLAAKRFADRTDRRLCCVPVAIGSRQRSASKVVARSNHYAMGIGLDPHDKGPFSQGHAESAALSDRETFNSGMLPQHFSFHRDDLAARIDIGASGADEFIVLTTRHEANLLAIALFGHSETNFMSQLADLRLVVVADRQQHARQQFFFDSKQDVRLIFTIVDTTAEREFAIDLCEPSIVAGCDKLGSHAVGVVKKFAELEPVVALHAGIGGPTDGVLVDEVVDDLPELGLQIEGVKRNVEAVGNATRVFGIARTTTALLVIRTFFEDRELKARCIDGASSLRFFAMTHENANHLVPSAREERGSDTAIDTSRHGQHDPRHEALSANEPEKHRSALAEEMRGANYFWHSV